MITVDGREALTTRQLAAEFDLDPASARTAIKRVRLAPVDHLDERTPLYDAATARVALAERPGRGGPGKPRTKREAPAAGVPDAP